MPDRISQYRQVRLIIDLPSEGTSKCHWSLIALSVRKGIPHAEVLDRGWTPVMPAKPGLSEIWEALQAVLVDVTEQPLF